MEKVNRKAVQGRIRRKFLVNASFQVYQTLLLSSLISLTLTHKPVTVRVSVVLVGILTLAAIL